MTAKGKEQAGRPVAQCSVHSKKLYDRSTFKTKHIEKYWIEITIVRKVGTG
jgi:hypothetical protein